MTHSITEKNLETMTGKCSIDGWVDIGYNGHAYFCKKAQAEAKRRSKVKNPEVTARNRNRYGRSKHQLSGTHCSVCGPVTPQPWGRGFMCPNRIRQLGWTPMAAPQPKCPRCMRNWLNADGKCPSCDDREATDVSYGIMLDEDRRRVAAFQLVDGEFRQVVERETDLPEGYESVTPEVPVLGAATPWNAVHQVKPEYAAIWLAGRQKEKAAHG